MVSRKASPRLRAVSGRRRARGFEEAGSDGVQAFAILGRKLAVAVDCRSSSRRSITPGLTVAQRRQGLGHGIGFALAKPDPARGWSPAGIGKPARNGGSHFPMAVEHRHQGAPVGATEGGAMRPRSPGSSGKRWVC